MNDAHLHLMINHVSLFTLVIGVFALAFSMKRKSAELRTLASVLFVITGIFGWISYETGEKAEQVVKALGGDFETFIHAHEQAAVWALRSGFLVATLAIALEWAVRKKKTWVKALQWTLLVFAIHGCTVYMATALQGGKIRHTEVR